MCLACEEAAATIFLVIGHAGEVQGPFLERFERHQDAQDRRLSGARRADQRHLLAGYDVEAEIVEDGQVAVALGHILEADQWLRHLRAIPFFGSAFSSQ